MTGRERVKACLTFNNPDRSPRDIWPLPYIILFREEEYKLLLEEFPMDISMVEPKSGYTDESFKLYAKAGQYRDEWGNIWHVGEPGVIGEVKKPILDDWSKLNKFKPPYNIIKDRDISYINKSCEESSKFMLSQAAARPFECLQFLRGTQNLYMDMAYNIPQFHRLLKIVHEFYLEDIRNWCKTNVDGIFFMDDWGANKALLISPEKWREVFKPLYKDYCDIIHSAGKFAFYHTDGFTEPIYNDFIDVGIDAINSQLFVMNIEELGKRYKGKITFWGEIDRQHILPFGTPEDVKKAVLHVRKVLDDGSGGVIAHCEWGKSVSIANIKAVFEAWN